MQLELFFSKLNVHNIGVIYLERMQNIPKKDFLTTDVYQKVNVSYFRKILFIY